MRARRSLLAGAVALLTSCAVMAGPQKPTSQTPVDPREAIALNAHERAHMMEGMRLYLQALQGIVATLQVTDCVGRHQCSVRGMVSVNGAMSASKWAPSSASIW